MKIRCVLKREGGTKIEMDGLEYHFEPLEDGEHVAVVSNKTHRDRLLGIPEAYRLYDGEHEPKAKEPVKVKPVIINDAEDVRLATNRTGRQALMGSSSHEPVYEIGGKPVELVDVIQFAFEASGLTADQWNALEEEDRAARIDIVLDEMAEAAEGEPAQPSDRETLANQYREKFGKAPHYRWDAAKIQAALATEDGKPQE